MTYSSTQRLVRFLAKDGRTYYGDAILAPGAADLTGVTKARVIHGDIFGRHRVTDQIAEVAALLAPLARADIGTVRCLGLNYEQHAKESNLPTPKSSRDPSHPVDEKTWQSWFRPDGRPTITEEEMRREIFRRGISPEGDLRKKIWPFLLGVYPWDVTQIQRMGVWEAKRSVN